MYNVFIFHFFLMQNLQLQKVRHQHRLLNGIQKYTSPLGYSDCFLEATVTMLAEVD